MCRLPLRARQKKRRDLKTYKARGIVLHTIKYGDSSLVAYVLTDTLGRISYMVQGVRSKHGRGNRGALLQPVFLIELEGMVPQKGEMHRIREVHAAVPLRTIPFDARKSSIALFMAEMLYRLVREVESNSPLFDFVSDAVETLDGMGGDGDRTSMEGCSCGDWRTGADNDGKAAIANFHLWFMVGLSRHLGFFPGNEWAPGRWFDIREGLFVPAMPLHGLAFSIENSELLGALMDVDAIEGLAALRLNRSRRVEFLNAMLSYFGYHLDAVRDVRSVDILREVF